MYSFLSILNAFVISVCADGVFSMERVSKKQDFLPLQLAQVFKLPFKYEVFVEGVLSKLFEKGMRQRMCSKMVVLHKGGTSFQIFH